MPVFQVPTGARFVSGGLYMTNTGNYQTVDMGFVPDVILICASDGYYSRSGVVTGVPISSGTLTQIDMNSSIIEFIGNGKTFQVKSTAGWSPMNYTAVKF